jgi:hypothetical protein
VNRTALYRYFGRGGELLYVGITSNPMRRETQHKLGSRWFSSVHRRTIEWFGSLAEAQYEEATAITQENPLFNQNMCAVHKLGCFRLTGPYYSDKDAAEALGIELHYLPWLVSQGHLRRTGRLGDRMFFTNRDLLGFKRRCEAGNG